MTQPPQVDQFFRAMQAGATHADQMMSLFSDDAVYVEPFTGQPATHAGKAEIRAVFEAGWQNPLPDMRINVDWVELKGDTVEAGWTCFSPALPNGSGSGVNWFTIRDGLIVRLETQFRTEAHRGEA
ncbi:MAG: nuclear transport factor 2 family protein [Chloroflexota bacterium]